MSKSKTSFACGQCGTIATKWAGQCGDCGSWNSLTEVVLSTGKNRALSSGAYGSQDGTLMSLSEVSVENQQRIPSGLDELDRVLGGGLVVGSVVLLGGDPGIGKSTLLLQSLASLPEINSALYVTGEESLSQVSLRAQRLGLGHIELDLLAETQIETMINVAKTKKPKVMVIDSIQTIFTEMIQSAPGSVSQVRESAAHLVRFAKSTGTAIYLVGHVTKDGALAGPRVLEHMVDVVLYFEGQKDSRFRMIRAMKNRFGAVNELGVFAMTDRGLKPVSNPSALFLSRNASEVSGSSILVTWEGNRPFLIEIQALVNESQLPQPRRVTVGVDQNRLALLLAVLHRHAGKSFGQWDVFVNVVGGMRVSETGVDLAIICSLISSYNNKPLDKYLAIFGEVGLGGEIRPVQGGQERIQEAHKHGFKRIIVPKANAPKKSAHDIEIMAVSNVQEVLQLL